MYSEIINKYINERMFLSISVFIVIFILGFLELRYSKQDTASQHIFKLQKHQRSVYKKGGTLEQYISKCFHGKAENFSKK